MWLTSFTLAVSRNYSRQGEERQTDWIDVVAWRNTAEFVCKYFTKGQMMAVTGSIQTRSYEDRSGNKRKAVEIQANDVSFVGSKRDNPSGGDYGQAYTRPSSPEPKRDNAGGDDFGQSYGQSYARPSAPAPQQPAAFSEPAPAYSSGSSEDFEEILGDDDLPF